MNSTSSWAMPQKMFGHSHRVSFSSSNTIYLKVTSDGFFYTLISNWWWTSETNKVIDLDKSLEKECPWSQELEIDLKFKKFHLARTLKNSIYPQKLFVKFDYFSIETFKVKSWNEAGPETWFYKRICNSHPIIVKLSQNS